MKKYIFLIYLGTLLLTRPVEVNAAASATQTVTFSVGSIQTIAVSGNPAPLNITTAIPGSTPTPVTDSSTTYSLTTNVTTAQTISGALNSAMPSNTTLTITLAAPTGATSTGPINLTTSSQNLVTGINPIAQSELGITYTFSATAAVVPFAATTRIVTLTLGP